MGVGTSNKSLGCCTGLSLDVTGGGALVSLSATWDQNGGKGAVADLGRLAETKSRQTLYPARDAVNAPRAQARAPRTHPIAPPGRAHTGRFEHLQGVSFIGYIS